MHECESERQRLMAHIINACPGHGATAVKCFAILKKWPMADLRKLVAGLENGLALRVQIPKGDQIT
jgi:hypothetical protein